MLGVFGDVVDGSFTVTQNGVQSVVTTGSRLGLWDIAVEYSAGQQVVRTDTAVSRTYIFEALQTTTGDDPLTSTANWRPIRGGVEVQMGGNVQGSRVQQFNFTGNVNVTTTADGLTSTLNFPTTDSHYRGDYDNSVLYTIGQVVRFNTNFYIKEDNSAAGTPPTTVGSWGRINNADFQVDVGDFDNSVGNDIEFTGDPNNVAANIRAGAVERTNLSTPVIAELDLKPDFFILPQTAELTIREGDIVQSMSFPGFYIYDGTAGPTTTIPANQDLTQAMIRNQGYRQIDLDTNTTYSFQDGTNGTFTVTPSDSSPRRSQLELVLTLTTSLSLTHPQTSRSLSLMYLIVYA